MNRMNLGAYFCFINITCWTKLKSMSNRLNINRVFILHRRVLSSSNLLLPLKHLLNSFGALLIIQDLKLQELCTLYELLQSPSVYDVNKVLPLIHCPYLLAFRKEGSDEQEDILPFWDPATDRLPAEWIISNLINFVVSHAILLPLNYRPRPNHWISWIFNLLYSTVQATQSSQIQHSNHLVFPFA